jgi:type IV pilus assembly protein PilY1
MNAGSDGIVNPANKDESVQVFSGMRRGGSNYYALDVTDPQDPRLMWTIKGRAMGSNYIAEEESGTVEYQTASLGFEKLGQSWSQPLPAKILWNGDSKNVLIFAGGFDPNLEGTKFEYKTSKIGNAIYMVSLEKNESGQLLWWASDSNDNGEGNNAQFLKLADMNYAIPSTVALIDSDGDRHKDRLYVGDMHGQVWRIEFDGLGTSSAGVGAVLARIGDDGNRKHRFFYPPAVYLDEKNDWVTITSGSRPIPLDTEIRERFFCPQG